MQQQVVRKRPLGITIIAIIEIVSAILSLLASLVLIATPLGIGIAIASIIRLIVAWGLWTLKPWAFWTAVILEVFNICLNLSNLLVGHTSPVPAVLFGLILDLVVLAYLFADKNVRAAFRT
jgi:uncharacterized membrane protein (DUF2068 family)